MTKPSFERRDTLVGMRCEPSLKSVLASIAATSDRSLSAVVRDILLADPLVKARLHAWSFECPGANGSAA